MFSWWLFFISFAIIKYFLVTYVLWNLNTAQAGAEGRGVEGMWRMQPRKLHVHCCKCMKITNKIESSIFVLLCFPCFQRQSFRFDHTIRKNGLVLSLKCVSELYICVIFFNTIRNLISKVIIHPFSKTKQIQCSHLSCIPCNKIEEVYRVYPVCLIMQIQSTLVISSSVGCAVRLETRR